jgi:hypothetical protein
LGRGEGGDLIKFLRANKAKKEEKIFEGIDTFLFIYFPYFFPLLQANEIAKALFSLPSPECSVFTKG